MTPRKESRRTKICPHCGELIHRKALACPECGSDERTGWRDPADIDYLSVDLPEESSSRSGRWFPPWVMALVALLTVLALVLSLL